MQKIYTFFVAASFILLFLLCLPFFVVFNFFGAWGRRASWRVITIWARVWFQCSGFKNQNIYEEKPQMDKQYIVVANHCSYLDTPVIFRAIPFFVRPLATAEYGKIPIFGFLYRHLAVTIDRSNNKSKADGIKQLKATLEEGSSVFIFPEGKFNESPALLQPFFDGAFKMAVQTNTPILPLLFLDTERRMPYKKFGTTNPGLNRVVYLPAIDTASFQGDAKALKEHVWGEMNKYFNRYVEKS